MIFVQGHGQPRQDTVQSERGHFVDPGEREHNPHHGGRMTGP